MLIVPITSGDLSLVLSLMRNVPSDRLRFGKTLEAGAGTSSSVASEDSRPQLRARRDVPCRYDVTTRHSTSESQHDPPSRGAIWSRSSRTLAERLAEQAPMDIFADAAALVCGCVSPRRTTMLRANRKQSGVRQRRLILLARTRPTEAGSSSLRQLVIFLMKGFVEDTLSSRF
jgi:hypothetical protein